MYFKIGSLSLWFHCGPTATAMLTDILFLDYKENCYLVLETHSLSGPGSRPQFSGIDLIFTSRLDLMQEASRLKSSQTHSRGQKARADWRQRMRERRGRSVSILSLSAVTGHH